MRSFFAAITAVSATDCMSDENVLLQLSAKHDGEVDSLSTSLFHDMLPVPDGSEVEVELELHLAHHDHGHHHEEHFHDHHEDEHVDQWEGDHGDWEGDHDDDWSNETEHFDHHFDEHLDAAMTEKLDLMIRDIATHEDVPIEEVETAILVNEVKDMPIAKLIEEEEMHIEDLSTEFTLDAGNEDINERLNDFEEMVEPDFAHECADGDSHCKLPSMDEDRCARQCAWEEWLEQEGGMWEPSGELTINKKCYDVCTCEVDHCDSLLPEGFTHWDHHSDNHDFDWGHAEDVMSNSGFRDCGRQMCHGMWEEGQHCGIDWSMGHPWEKIELGDIHGIKVIDEVMKADAIRHCDPFCEATHHCEMDCTRDAESRCGDIDLRAESCHDIDDEWCAKDFWSCKWNTQPEECQCWQMDEEKVASYDTCEIHDEHHHDEHHDHWDHPSLRQQITSLAKKDMSIAKKFLIQTGLANSLIKQ